MSEKKRALITGITGQDGSYLAELLLEKGYTVFGMERRASRKNHGNIKHIKERIELVSGDLLDQSSLVQVLLRTTPDEVYNLASQSFVAESWNTPVYTHEVTGTGAVRLLEAIRQVSPKIKFYQASSSEMFGAVEESPQNERTRFRPRSPYGIAKLAAHWSAVNYRESYGMFIVCGILFNHESPRRGLEFVSRKITWHAARIKAGLENELRLGDMNSKRDWGFAGDYVEAMWLMLQQPEPDDYVIATGEQHSVTDFVEAAFGYFGLPWDKYVRVDQKLFRPADVFTLCGDASKARQKLGWESRTNFLALVELMAEGEEEELLAELGSIKRTSQIG